MEGRITLSVRHTAIMYWLVKGLTWPDMHDVMPSGNDVMGVNDTTMGRSAGDNTEV